MFGQRSGLCSWVPLHHRRGWWLGGHTPIGRQRGHFFRTSPCRVFGCLDGCARVCQCVSACLFPLNFMMEICRLGSSGCTPELSSRCNDGFFFRIFFSSCSADSAKIWHHQINRLNSHTPQNFNSHTQLQPQSLCQPTGRAHRRGTAPHHPSASASPLGCSALSSPPPNRCRSRGRPGDFCRRIIHRWVQCLSPPCGPPDPLPEPGFGLHFHKARHFSAARCSRAGAGASGVAGAVPCLCAPPSTTAHGQSLSG